MPHRKPSGKRAVCMNESGTCSAESGRRGTIVAMEYSACCCGKGTGNKLATVHVHVEPFFFVRGYRRICAPPYYPSQFSFRQVTRQTASAQPGIAEAISDAAPTGPAGSLAKRKK